MHGSDWSSSTEAQDTLCIISDPPNTETSHIRREQTQKTTGKEPLTNFTDLTKRIIPS